jgi:hypothetical protein
LLGHFFAVQGIWDLNQYARTITHQFVCTHSTTVIQVLQNLQGLGDHVVTLVTFDVRHKTHTTGVVFLIGVVQTLSGEFLSLVGLVHGAYPFEEEKELSNHCAQREQFGFFSESRSIVVRNNNAKSNI